MLKAATSVTSSASTKAATGAESEKNVDKILQNFSVQQAGMRKGATMDPSYVLCSFRAFPNPEPHQYHQVVSCPVMEQSLGLIKRTLARL